MSERTVQTVECELCGETFDPTDAGGWCTNPECGEWKYAGAEVTDASAGDATNEGAAASEGGEKTIEKPTDAGADAADGSSAAAADESDDEGDTPTGEDQAGADGDGASAEHGTDGPATTDSADEPDLSDDVGGQPGLSDGEGGQTDADAGADATDTAADPEATGPDVPAPDEIDFDDSESTADESVVECVDCGAEVERDANFCPTCGGEVVERTVDEDELTECPSCGNDVEPGDNFCAACGEDLAAHRTSEELTACPECSADVEEDDAFCAQCGEDLDAHRGADDHELADDGASDAGAAEETEPAASDAATADDGTEAPAAADEATATAPETLSLTAYGRSIDVGDGDAVGREIRSLLAEAGRPDDEAVRIHREHVRFVREDGQFHLVDLGDNPTAVEGTTLSKGDRTPIGPGDEITLSEVVTLTVESPDA